MKSDDSRFTISSLTADNEAGGGGGGADGEGAPRLISYGSGSVYASSGGFGTDAPMDEVEEEAVLTLGRFVPDFVLDHVHKCRFSDEGEAHSSFDCICVFGDISGFTKLSDLYNQHGAGVTLAGINKAHQGAERMRTELNRYFGEMINFIVDAGGDVVKFAGDALMAVWRLDNYEDLRDLDASAAREVAEKLRAICLMCMEMTAKLDGWIVEGLASYKATNGSVEKTYHQLHLHTAVTVGRIESYVVGGFGGGQWLQTLAGPPIDQITDCIDQAKQSEVVISGECVALLRRGHTDTIQEKEHEVSATLTGSLVQGLTSPKGITKDKGKGKEEKGGDPDSLLDILDKELDEGAHSLIPFRKAKRSVFGAPSFSLLSKTWSGSSIKSTSTSSVASSTGSGAAGHGRFAEKIRNYALTWVDSGGDGGGGGGGVKRTMKSSLRSFVPAPVLRAIRSGSASSGELRRLTILFLHLDPPQQDSDRLRKIQGVCGIIQREVQKFEGYLKEVTVDDKGFVVGIMFFFPF